MMGWYEYYDSIIFIEFALFCRLYDSYIKIYDTDLLLNIKPSSMIACWKENVKLLQCVAKPNLYYMVWVRDPIDGNRTACVRVRVAQRTRYTPQRVARL